MSFWTIFAACALAQALGLAIGIGCGLVANYLKRRRQRTALIGVALPRAEDAIEAALHPLGPEEGLLPCPFCGHSELRVSRFAPKPECPPHGAEFAVFCYTCGTTGPGCLQPERAEDLWNARRTPVRDADEQR